MIFLLNVLFAAIAGVLTNWVLETKVGLGQPLSVLIALVVAIVVFIANFASQVL